MKVNVESEESHEMTASKRLHGLVTQEGFLNPFRLLYSFLVLFSFSLLKLLTTQK